MGHGGPPRRAAERRAHGEDSERRRKSSQHSTGLVRTSTFPLAGRAALYRGGGVAVRGRDQGVASWPPFPGVSAARLHDRRRERSIRRLPFSARAARGGSRRAVVFADLTGATRKPAGSAVAAGDFGGSTLASGSARRDRRRERRIFGGNVAARKRTGRGRRGARFIASPRRERRRHGSAAGSTFSATISNWRRGFFVGGASLPWGRSDDKAGTASCFIRSAAPR